RPVLKARDLGLERLAPSERVDPGGKLRKGEGLDEIVVGAGFEAVDPVLDSAEGRQQQNRGVDIGGADAADNAEPVRLRQHSVEDRYVKILGREDVECVAAAFHDKRIVAELTQPLPDELGRFRVIFRYQDPHRADQPFFFLASVSVLPSDLFSTTFPVLASTATSWTLFFCLTSKT